LKRKDKAFIEVVINAKCKSTGSIGELLPGMKARIVDESGNGK